jgi:ectoine hydroxylase-related dioxygenase (phytanoyl-CoA dioxygenase family)
MPMSTTSSSHPRLPVFDADSSAIAISALDDSSILAELRGIVRSVFDQPAAYYVNLQAEEYRRRVSQAQDEINRNQVARRLARDRHEALSKILGTSDIMLQSHLYLRATRPLRQNASQEFVGWHRESFYGPDMDASINLWMPVDGVTVENTLRYVPNSHTIPDEEILLIQEQDQTMPRYSAGHRIGLLYAPKRIVGGVDFAAQRPLIVPYGSVAMFAGALIHGAAENRSEGLRFSVDFRLIAAENLTVSKQHFPNEKSYFEPL